MTVDEAIKSLRNLSWCEDVIWTKERIIEFLEQQQAEIELLKSDRSEFDMYIENQAREIGQLKAQQPVKCYECEYFYKTIMLKKGICKCTASPFYDSDFLTETMPNDYCNYGKRKEVKTDE